MLHIAWATGFYQLILKTLIGAETPFNFLVPRRSQRKRRESFTRPKVVCVIKISQGLALACTRAASLTAGPIKSLSFINTRPVLMPIFTSISSSLTGKQRITLVIHSYNSVKTGLSEHVHIVSPATYQRTV